MTLSPDDWQRAKALFESLAERPPAERAAALADPALAPGVLAEVRSLLAHHDAATEASGGFLAPAAVSAAAQALGLDGAAEATAALGGPDASTGPLQPGLRLGAWRLVEHLGRGGMGEVWAAERADGAYLGEAAVKVLRAGLEAGSVLRRFALEQQALARLNHPHIAHLIDAGRTPDGRPYFVMERVHGQPIDVACAGRPLAERLGLFLQLADAVAHAHRALLVHRDLKPGNVLVTAEGQVKLLDFGIAKALDPVDTALGSDPMDTALLSPDQAAASATQLGERPFSPRYASPEQVRGEPVGTATDVYSLGVLLYVMLTGVRPYGREADTAAAAARSVLEEAPTRPSTLPASLVPEPDWLQRRQRLKGDLDAILLRALSKAVSTRYVSVDAMAEDLRAYLGGHPVSAQPHNALYVLRKFVGRNRVVVAVAGLAVLALAGGFASTAVQKQTAEARLAQLRDVTRDVVLRYGDAVTFLPGGLVVKEQLLQTLLANLEKIEKEAGSDAEWLALLAGAYARLAEIQGDDTGASLDKLPDARSNAQRAIDLATRAERAGRADPSLVAAHAQALRIRAQGLRAEGKPEQGLRDLDEALARLDRDARDAVGGAATRALRLQHASVQLVRAQFYDQQTVASMNQPEKALQLYAEAAQALLKLDSEQAEPQVAALLGTLYGARAITHARLNRLDLAQNDAETAFRQRLRSVQAEPFNTAWRDGLVNEATNAAVILLRADRPAPALEASRAAWAEVQQLARENGPDSKWLAMLPRVAQHHGRALVANGQYAEALPVLAQAQAFWRQTAQAKPGPHPQRMQAWLALYEARALNGVGQPAQARQRLGDAVAVLDPLAVEPKARDAQLNLGEACLLLAELEPSSRAAWQKRALQAYTAAQRFLPLTGDHLRNFVAAGGKPVTPPGT